MDERMVRLADDTTLLVESHGVGPDVLVLSGGPGCVHYLAREDLVPEGWRAWFPTPRGVGRSSGGAHAMSRAVADLEEIRRALGIPAWRVLGHSWGSDLAVRYALDHPASVSAVVGIAGHGLHKDRTWGAAYEARSAGETPVEIEWDEAVHRSLNDSFADWIHEPRLWRRLADSAVPMTFIAAGDDIRPSWPLRQLAELVPDATFETIPGVPHDVWSTSPGTWRAVVTRALAQLSTLEPQA